MKLLVALLIAFLLHSSSLVAQHTAIGSEEMSKKQQDSVSSPEAKTGVYFGIGIGLSGNLFPYQDEFSYYHNPAWLREYGTEKFGDPARTSNALYFKLLLGYKYYDFRLFVEAEWLTNPEINSYSYSWDNFDLPCGDRWQSGVGCKRAYIEMEAQNIYGIGVDWNVWKKLYLTAKAQSLISTLRFGIETWGEKNEGNEKEFYREKVYTAKIGSGWMLHEKSKGVNSSIVCLLGWSKGDLTNNFCWEIGLTLDGLMFSF